MKSFEKRFEAVVIARLPKALERIQEDMEEFGNPLMDVRRMGGEILKALSDSARRNSKECEEGKCGVLLSIGKDEDNIGPLSIARSFAIAEVRNSLERWCEILKKFEASEKEKLAVWAGRTGLGDKPLFNFKKLAVVESLAMERGEIDALRFAFHVIGLSREQAKELLDKTRDGHPFMSEFLGAYSSTDRYAALIRDMWSASREDLKVILEDASIAGGEHSRPLAFYGQLLASLRSLTSEEQSAVLEEIEAE